MPRDVQEQEHLDWERLEQERQLREDQERERLQRELEAERQAVLDQQRRLKQVQEGLGGEARRKQGSGLPKAASASRVSHQPEQSDATVGVSPEISRETLVNAVVWAEILGSPRSKKPYVRR